MSASGQHHEPHLADVGAAVLSGDYEMAVHILEPLVAAGDAEAAFVLGQFYFGGRGVERDQAEAVRLYTLAAEQGHIDAQFELGAAHQMGNGIPPSYDQAAIWYRTAAERGHGQAQLRLGTFYDNGYGVEQDHAQAAQWYLRAAEQGHAWGWNNLARHYAQGLGVSQDFAEAARLYRIGADLGLAAAQFNLARLYLEGRGLDQSREEAIALFRAAAAQEHREALEMLEQLAVALEAPDTWQADPGHVTNGRVETAQPVLDFLVARRAAGNSLLTADDAIELRRLILEDGQFDEHERDMVMELTHPDIRVIVFYPAGQEDPWAGENASFATLNSTVRPELLGMIDVALEAKWLDQDLRPAIAELVASSRVSPERAIRAQRFLSIRAAEVMSNSTSENHWAPLRALILDIVTVVDEMEAAGDLDTAAIRAVRHLVYLAIDEANLAVGAEVPRFLYSYMMDV
ncbi:tetratricopeptide repeat protein [Pelagibacterium montanilacus]|uniref:tetratricopeptide repeat protein n=1 Tax=Pelagibacterium montanilacus TaxID=2185280 RepID=UPI0013DFF703|nr:tetratricopeptide repeat protein [Pelagibacterium montanilacus]